MAEDTPEEERLKEEASRVNVREVSGILGAILPTPDKEEEDNDDEGQE